jgi:hypothetical protein
MKKILASLLLTISLATPAAATAQYPEIINIDGGAAEGMTVEPLGIYLDNKQNYDRFKPYIGIPGCTALWRGYVGHWIIKNRKLYLNKFEVNACRGDDTPQKFISLAKLFPGKPQPVFADWYSDVLILPRGKMLEYVHMGYGSRYEKYLIVTIEKGLVVKQETITDREYQRRYRSR